MKYKEETNKLQEEVNYLASCLSAIINQMRKDHLTTDIKSFLVRAGNQGKVDILRFWEVYTHQDKMKVKRLLDELSPHERDILKTLL